MLYNGKEYVEALGLDEFDYEVWSTTDPEEIRLAIESLMRGGSVRYNDNWIHKRDNQFLNLRGNYSAGLNYNTSTGQLWYLSGSGMGGAFISQLTQISRGRIMDYYTGNDTDNGTIRSLMLLGAGLSADKAQVFARFFQSSNAAVRDAAVLNNMPTAQIDKIMGNTNKFLTGAKWAGKGFFITGTAMSSVQGINSLIAGDYPGVAKSGLDIGMGAVASFGGPVGLAIGGTYFLLDALGAFEGPMYMSAPIQTGYFPNDNTYVAPLIYIW